jgi:hypothetical protein
MQTIAFVAPMPFYRWFRDVVRDVHGIDLAVGFEPPQQALDFRA